MKFFTFANQLTIVAATKRSLKLGILGTCDPQFALAASFNPLKVVTSLPELQFGDISAYLVENNLEQQQSLSNTLGEGLQITTI